MIEEKLYTSNQVGNVNLYPAVHLDSSIEDDMDGIEGESTMPKRNRQRVTMNGRVYWIEGHTNQDLMDAYMRLCIAEGIVAPNGMSGQKVLFGDYLDEYNLTYRTKRASLTKTNNEQVINKHIKPRLGRVPIDEITTAMIQRWFNELAESYAHETILKIRNIMNPAFEAAEEDGLIQRNPLRSRRLQINGRETDGHKAIPAIKMEEIRNGIQSIQNERDRRLAALLSYTGMRFEEVLGLRWEDFDLENGLIHICRAVVHPTRNYPEVKVPKTKTSTRDIPIVQELADGIAPLEDSGYLLYSGDPESPLSYTEARRSFQHIRERFGLDGYSAHDFRDTCATEWREAGLPLDLIARLLGHAKTETTERRYVKYRNNLFDSVRDVMNGQCANVQLDRKPYKSTD